MIAHINKVGKCVFRSNLTGSDLVPTLMDMSTENLLSVVEVTRAVYAIPTNRKEEVLDPDSDSIEKFG